MLAKLQGRNLRRLTLSPDGMTPGQTGFTSFTPSLESVVADALYCLVTMGASDANFRLDIQLPSGRARNMCVGLLLGPI